MTPEPGRHRDPPELLLCLVFGRQLARDQKKEIPNEQFERACLNVDVIKGRVRLIAVDEPASEAVTLFEEVRR